MNNECCHQHPENGSDLALQTEAQREETDLRDLNVQLLAALEAVERHDRGHGLDCDACNQAHAAIEEANK